MYLFVCTHLFVVSCLVDYLFVFMWMNEFLLLLIYLLLVYFFVCGDECEDILVHLCFF